MLKIRLSRTGKRTQESFRVVVADHHKAVKREYLENLGHYNPTKKQLVIEKERIAYWIKNGAQPTETVAALLKKNGVSNMEKYIKPRIRNKKSKKAGEGEAAAA